MSSTRPISTPARCSPASTRSTRISSRNSHYSSWLATKTCATGRTRSSSPRWTTCTRWQNNRDGVSMSHPASWARLLIARDDVQGPEVLKRMIEYYEEHDGNAWDFGRLNIVADAQAALDHASRMNQ